MKQARVASLHVYPIKSCGGIDVESFHIGERGPDWDRGWMIADSASGVFLSQRQHIKMAMIRPKIEPDALSVSLPSGDRVSIPLSLVDSPAPRHVRVWNDDCEGIDEGDDAASLLSDYLGLSVRLVRMAPSFKRLIPEKFEVPGANTGFADAMPVLLATRASLDDLSARVGSTIPMNRFRPNLVVSGSLPYEEDGWSSLRIGNVEFKVSKPCARCVIINTDQMTGARGTEPLKTLATYRKAEGSKVLFGQYLIHLNQGEVRVGDPIEIICEV